jgi:hypothetical protein
MYVEGNPVNFTDPTGLFSQSQIRHMFKSARYLEAVSKYRNNPYLSGRWGFWEVLHRADNNDRIEFYTFSLNGDCARDAYSPNPILTQPFLRIKGIRHAISNVEKGRIFWSGSTLWFKSQSGSSTPIWERVRRADYVILQNEFGAEKFSTFINTQYSEYRLILDEVDWREFWLDLGGVTGTALMAMGLTIESGGTIFIAGLGITVVVAAVEISDIIVNSLMPIVNEIRAGNDPAPEKIKKFNEAIRYVTESEMEQAIEAFSKMNIPIFDIKGLLQNIGNAIKYTP